VPSLPPIAPIWILSKDRPEARSARLTTFRSFLSPNLYTYILISSLLHRVRIFVNIRENQKLGKIVEGLIAARLKLLECTCVE
jgi:hypothetical protein